MPKRSDNSKDLVGVDKGFEALASMLEAEDESRIGFKNFDDFVQNIFSLSYPQYNFNTWHVRLISHHIDNAFQTGGNLLVVLPRYHLKSTICNYAANIYRMLTKTGDGMLISYKDELANYHMSNIKTAVANNPKLSKIMHDLHKQSEAGIGYQIGQYRRSRIISSGIFSVKRGIHTDILTIADDVLGDLQNPMALQELEKTQRIFDAEIMNIPNKGCPIFVIGTVIDYSDLLFRLSKNPGFDRLWMPAVNPTPEHDVLWEAQYDKKWLDQRKETGGWKAFATEFLLMPVLATEAFLTREDLDKVIDKNLKNFQVPGW